MTQNDKEQMGKGSASEQSAACEVMSGRKQENSVVLMSFGKTLATLKTKANSKIEQKRYPLQIKRSFIWYIIF